MGKKSIITEIDFSVLKKEIHPPADRNQSTVIFDHESKVVIISGVFLNGPTNLTLEQADMRYNPEEDYLCVEIQEKEKEGVMTAHDIEQTIPYRVDIDFDGAIPSKVEVIHKRRGGKTVYNTSEEIF